MNYTLKKISGILGYKPVINGRVSIIKDLIIDTRKIIFPDESCFFALRGDIRDGHDFVLTAYQLGVRNFVVSVDEVLAECREANFIVVPSVLEALQKIAKFHRAQFDIPIIGITGSHGKTIIKEWLYELLSQDFTIAKNPKSFNSQIGVPLSVWTLDYRHNLGIFEAGISLPGEMKALGEIIKPDIGILTNIGAPHDEGFDSRIKKLHEKLLLFQYAHTLIYNSDHLLIEENIDFLKTINPSVRFLRWGSKVGCFVQILKTEPQKSFTKISYLYQDTKYQVELPFVDSASIENALHCLVLMLALDCNPEDCSKRISQLHNLPLRLELKAALHNCSLIYDCYNSDLDSLRLALDFTVNQSQNNKKTVILSDIYQSGLDENKLYSEVAKLLSNAGITRLIGIGLAISRSKKLRETTSSSIFFNDTNEFLNNINSLSFEDETILLKGARMFKIERIGKLLEAKAHQTVLEINLNALVHNLRIYQSILKPGVKTMVMVKAFSYGSGSFEIANLLQFNQVDYLAVAYIDEGVELRNAGIRLPIMVMNPAINDLERMIEYQLEPEIFSFRMLDRMLLVSEKMNCRHFPVHVKIDTGMNRLGFNLSDCKEISNKIKSTTAIKVASVFSHLAASEDPAHDQFSKHQIDNFELFVIEFKKFIGYHFLSHILNSSGLVRFPEYQLDMVRLGIGLYGVDTSRGMHHQLLNISTLKSTISQIRVLAEGQTIGYGRIGYLKSAGRIATVGIGYADGVRRSMGNGKGYMLVRGKRATIIGNICMDMTMIDVTNIPEANEGDEVIIFGELLPISKLADWAGTIPYEILTGISQRVKRIYFEE